jgi:hypothetical protein
MDITTNELKTMKAKQLRRIIKEVISEVLNEATEQDATNAEKKASDLKKQAADAELVAANIKKQIASSEQSTLGEMARIAKGYRLADPEVNSTQFANKRVSGTPLTDVIEFFRDHPGAEKTALQRQFNFARPQIANALVNGLLDAGVLIKLNPDGNVVEPVEPGEETNSPVVVASEPEDMFMGGSENPLAMYFDNEPNNDETEDFNDSEEPTVGELEPSVATNQIADEDYEAMMEYDKLKQRLDATKSNILKLRRSKGAPGDIADKPSSEVERLRTLKTALDTRIKALITSSPYLQKRLGMEPTAPEIEEPEEEETLDEWTIHKMKFYAGIIK